jgi:hypothetical protein
MFNTYWVHLKAFKTYKPKTKACYLKKWANKTLYLFGETKLL